MINLDLNDFFADFDKEFYKFTRPTKDMKPYRIVNKDEKTFIVVNAVGIKKEDIKITSERLNRTDYLVINGESKNEILNTSYSINLRFIINPEAIENIEWFVEDGLLYIECKTRQVKSEINIKAK